MKPKLLVPLLAAVTVVLFVLYILFAPPTMPKPIYIRFEESAAAEAPTAAAVTAVAPVASRAEHGGEVIPYRPGEGIMFSLGTKIVNLAEPGGRRYLQIGVVLECLPSDVSFYDLRGEARVKAEEQEIEELEALRPVMEDAVIGLLTSRTYAEIFTMEGKSQLKREMLSEINGVLGYEKVASVYFTEFLVQ
ncbi:MAG: flagellar basal body-associated FliL family protein [Anaerolineae bacterium]